MRLLPWILGGLLVSTGIALGQMLQGGLAFNDTNAPPLSGNTSQTIYCWYGVNNQMATPITATIFGYEHNISKAPLKETGGGQSIYRALDGMVQMDEADNMPILTVTRLYYVNGNGGETVGTPADSEDVNLLITKWTQVNCPQVKKATKKHPPRTAKPNTPQPNRTTTYVPPNTHCRYKAPGNDLGGPCRPRE